MLLVFLFFEVTTFQRAVQGLLALLLGIGGRASVYIYICGSQWILLEIKHGS